MQVYIFNSSLITKITPISSNFKFSNNILANEYFLLDNKLKNARNTLWWKVDEISLIVSEHCENPYVEDDFKEDYNLHDE